MDIVSITFEEPLIFYIKGEYIKVLAFQTSEHGHIKFGIEAPRSVKVHREEIYHVIRLKEEQARAQEKLSLITSD